MSKLTEQLQRLFAAPAAPLGDDAAAPLALRGADGRVRTLVIGFERSSDWPAVAALNQALQEALELPAPAISVSPTAGFQVWLPLAEAVAPELAAVFLDALRRNYLAELPAGRLRLLPLAAGSTERVPAADAASGKWSAFIDPGMGSMFVAEPGLEIAPNPDRQADMLASVQCITVKALQRALALLGAADAPALPEEAGRPRSTLAVGNNFTDPKDFLLAVMNDPAASTGQRIKAATALLRYGR